MTIDDQIRDENLQYDINREAAKISALLWNKIGKYEYLTGEETLPSNQKQIIEQAKFTYSPSGKAFEKQIKTIEGQRENQVEVSENLKDRNKQLANDYDDKLLISKERETFKNICNKRLDKTEELNKKNHYNNLDFITISTGIKTDFSKKDDPLTFLNKIKEGEITIEGAKESQKNFNNYLKKIRGGNKTQEQRDTLILEAKRKAAEELTEQDGTGLKILTPKQMLQRLPIALAQVKVSNNSENSLNETDKLVIFCISQNKSLKKYTIT